MGTQLSEVDHTMCGVCDILHDAFLFWIPLIMLINLPPASEVDADFGGCQMKVGAIPCEAIVVDVG